MNALLAEYDGFLPTRGTFMLDFVFAAMFLIVPLLVVSVYMARRRRFQLHKTLQVGMAVVLLAAVTAFEIDVQFIHPHWREQAKLSPFYDSGTVDAALIIHLCFAIPTPFLWIYVIVQALRKFPRPPQPGPHSPSHKWWGKAAAIAMFGTAFTGWVFYVMAFVV